jgi:hypothetical protein
MCQSAPSQPCSKTSRRPSLLLAITGTKPEWPPGPLSECQALQPLFAAVCHTCHRPENTSSRPSELIPTAIGSPSLTCALLNSRQSLQELPPGLVCHMCQTGAVGHAVNANTSNRPSAFRATFTDTRGEVVVASAG